MTQAKKIAVCAFLAALGVGVQLLATLHPPISPAIAAASGLFCAVAVIHCGLGWSLGVFAVCGVLGLVLCPTKSVCLFYLAFFGWYPTVKSLLERIQSRVWQWIAKVGVAAVGLGAAYFLYYRLFAEQSVFPWYVYLGVYALSLAAFVGYDLAFSLLISFYNRRIAPHIKL